MLAWPFWRAAFERAIRTVAQTLLALWLIGDVAFNALTVDWGEALGVSLGAAILSLLTSLVAEGVSPDTGPSLGTEKPVTAGRRQAGAISGDMVMSVALGVIVGGVVLWLLELLVHRV